jgi:protease-4
MKTLKIIPVLTLLAAFCAHAGGDIPLYHGEYDFLLTSPGSMGCGLYGFVNPAMTRFADRPDIYFSWSDQAGEWDDFDRWGIFTAVPAPRLSFGAIRREDDPGSVTDYRISTAFGTRASAIGFGYGWSSGDTEAYGRTNVWTVGSVSRMSPYVSTAIWGTFATSGGARQGVYDVGVRPLGDEKITLFGDFAVRDGQRLEDGTWSAGLALEPLPGVRLTGRYFDSEAFSVGLSFSLGRISLTSQSHFDDEQEHSYNTYGVRLGSMDRNVIRSFGMRRSRYVRLGMKGPVKYQRFKLFDRSLTLKGLLRAIDAAREDETVAGIAVNTSGMMLGREMAWEIREKIAEFKASGGHVVMYVEDVGLNEYHFASVADRIVMDPLGGLFLEGVSMGRTYYKGSLEKMGIAFDEWRFFKYKSAYEAFARESMSDGDREQHKAMAEDFYGIAREEICEARNLDPDRFDRLVNDKWLYEPDEAVELGLVDTVGRWEEVEKMIEAVEGESKDMVGFDRVARYELPHDHYWGEKPRVALIYGLGICAMDEGIKARSLSKIIEKAGNNDEIEAVVFRVDSPGGSGLASDIVADAILKCREKKPFIVSQGGVAASGGYWLSMYADTIVAAPATITGSIGVIGGWFYNQGLKEKLGMDTDLVKIGRHSDVGFGAMIPFLGSIPDRNLTPDEKDNVKKSIKEAYDDFVERVADGRGMEFEEVHEVGQGRVWTGLAGLDIGLVDVLGGLDTAIDIAKARAGIPADQEVDLIEMPEPPLFNAGMFTPRLFGFAIDTEEDPVLEYLRFRIEHNGEALPIMSIDDMDSF